MAIHWTAGNRRLIDLTKITHVKVGIEGVNVLPMNVPLSHSDGAELIWHWITPAWKKILIYGINRLDTDRLLKEYNLIHTILMEAING